MRSLSAGRLLTSSALLVALWAPSACSSKKAARPARETVLPLLQKEAQTVKAEGERIDPSLGVKAVWNIQSVDVQEQPSDESRPWKGSIRFRIESFTREPDGSVVTDKREKSFDYLFDAPSGRWLLQYTPGR